MHISAMLIELSVTGPAACAWFSSQWQSFAAGAGSALISSIWQSAVIVCALEIALRLAPRVSAGHRFALWSAGFSLAVAIPFLPLIHFGENSIGAVGPIAVSSSDASRAFLQIDARWGFAIAALWLIASLIRAAALLVHTLRLRQLWKAAQPVEIGAFSDFRNSDIEICTTDLLDRPSVIGFLSPRILIPDWLLSRLTPAELEQIVLHEAEHLHRRDDWTNLLQKLCLVLFPLNPALAWIEHRLCREREMACDEGVIRITNAPRAYAACLASLAERRLERRAEALSLGAWHRRSELVHRVHRILLHKRTMSSTAAGALLATLGFMLVAGSFEMSRFPQLVAFVPKHNTQALVPARQVQSAAKLDALLASENPGVNLQLPSGYRAMPAKAILPDRHSQASVLPRKHSAQKPATALPANPSAAPHSEQIAKADQNANQIGDRVISSEPQPQQWVVVATWREVTTVGRAPQTISDFATDNDAPQSPEESGAQSGSASQTVAVNTPNSASTNAPARQSTKAQNHPAAPAHQFTVTQLILRVVPASSNPNSTQPPTASVRDGWFVIQL